MDQEAINVGDSSTYRSYLLRLWREGQTGEPWRMSLQSAVTGERMGFATLDDLMAYLQRQIDRTTETALTMRDCKEVMP